MGSELALPYGGGDKAIVVVRTHANHGYLIGYPGPGLSVTISAVVEEYDPFLFGRDVVHTHPRTIGFDTQISGRSKMLMVRNFEDLWDTVHGDAEASETIRSITEGRG